MSRKSCISHLIEEQQWIEINTQIHQEMTDLFDRLEKENQIKAKTKLASIKRVKKRIAGCVYLVRAIGTNKYKIGRTSDVGKRFNQLRQGSPIPLELVAEWKTDDTASDEARLHSLFASQRTHGEWFNLDAKHIELAFQSFCDQPGCSKAKEGEA